MNTHYDHTVIFRVDAVTRREVTAAAAKERLTLSEWLRAAVRQYLRNMAKAK